MAHGCSLPHPCKRILWFALGPTLFTIGCVTTEEVAPARSSGGVVVSASGAGMWTVRAGGRLVGGVVRFEEGTSERFLYSVRDSLGLDLGLIDAEGRAWRYRPHQDPEWIHTGKVAAGVAAILGVGEPVELEPVDPAALPALFER